MIKDIDVNSKESRIKQLEDHIKVINTTIYPDNYERIKQVMLDALEEEIKNVKME